VYNTKVDFYEFWE
jgi:hypothetical protein